MGYIVAKAFKTVNRKFAVNDEVTPADIQGEVSFETWLKREFIKSAVAPAAKPVLAAPPAPVSPALPKPGGD